MMRIISQKDRIENQTEKYAGFSSEAKSGEEEMLSVLRHIEELARKTGVNLIYVKPAEGKSEGSIKKYYMSLEGESESQPLVRFFYEIETSPMLLRIERYSLVPASAGSRVIKVAATISRAVIL